MFRIGMQVHFGRQNGEQTLGEIVKLNPKTAKIKQLEPRSDRPIGTIWKVDYSLITRTFVNQDPIPYDPANNVVQNLLLTALAVVFQSRSELKQAPQNNVQQNVLLSRQIAGINLALGFEPTKAQVDLWLESSKMPQNALMR